MKFGLFGSAKSAPVNSDVDSAAGYKNWIKFNQEAEKLGCLLYTSPSPRD